MRELNRRRTCPICGADEPIDRREIDGWKLSTCRSCGFLYAPVIRENTATELDESVDYESMYRARHHQVHRLLGTLLPDGGVVVDVGAGFGVLGRIAAADGTFTYIGFEPSSSVAAQAQAAGVDLRNEFFDRSSLDEPADAVVLDNVLEHLSDPLALLDDCVAALRPGGVLVVIVPNRHDLRQLVPSWRRSNHWIPPEHINYFTPTSIRGAMREAGLEVHPFGFAALGRSDRKYWPRAAAEQVGVFPFGINLYGIRPG